MPPAGRISPPPPLSNETLKRACHRTARPRLQCLQPKGGGFESPGGCQRPSLRRLRVPGARIAAGVSVTRPLADTEGTPARDALPGRSCRSLGAQRVPPAAGRASAERPRTRRAKQRPLRSDQEVAASGPAGQEKASRSETEEPGRAPAGRFEPPTLRLETLDPGPRCSGARTS